MKKLQVLDWLSIFAQHVQGQEVQINQQEWYKIYEYMPFFDGWNFMVFSTVFQQSLWEVPFWQ